MNEDYLWDKSGDPDPAIQELEQILGTLRYQPQPLEIPEDLLVKRRSNYRWLLAIAAMVTFVILAAGLWLITRQQTRPYFEQANAPRPLTVPSGTVHKNETPALAALDTNTTRPTIKTGRGPGQSGSREVVASTFKRRTNSARGLDSEQRKEALAAKQQLMIALRLVSEKLSLAQRKTQGSSSPNQIRNQHKVG